MGFGRGKIVMALEGGHNLTSVANATQACIEMLLDYKPLIRSLEDLPLKPTWTMIKTVDAKIRQDEPLDAKDGLPCLSLWVTVRVNFPLLFFVVYHFSGFEFFPFFLFVWLYGCFRRLKNRGGRGSDYEFVLKTCRRAKKIEQTYDSASNSEEYESDFSNERKKKVKRQRKEPTNYFGDVMVKKSETSFDPLLFLGCSASSKSKFAPHLTGFLENFDDICSYNWCKYIVMTSKSLKAGGCAMLIPFWLCEHTHLVKPVNSVGFPRFMKWDLNELRKKLSRVNVADLDHKYTAR
ncbi:hypothetical protein ACS0TY_006760 [Phlomoides rotata]